MANVGYYQPETNTIQGASYQSVRELDRSFPSPHSALWAGISKAADQVADNQVTQLGEQQGAKAQHDAGSGSLVDAPDFGITTFGQAYKKAATQQYLVSKQFDFDNQVTPLREQYHGDPEGLKAALVPLQKSWMQDVPAQLLPTLSQHSDSRITTAIGEASNQQFALQRQERQASLVDNADAMRTQAYDQIIKGAQPSDIQDLLGQFQVLTTSAANQGASPSAVRRLREHFGQTIREAELTKQFRDTPIDQKQDWLDKLRSVQVDESGLDGIGLPPEVRHKLTGELHAEYNTQLAEVRRQQAEAQGVIANKLDDELAIRANTGKSTGLVTEGQVRAAFDPDKANAIVHSMNTATATYQAQQQISLSSPDQDKAILDRFEPKLGVGYAADLNTQNVLVKAINAKYAALATDPAAYVQSQAANKGMSDLINTDDPEKKQLYIATQERLQTAMGLRPDQQKLLPVGSVQALAQTINTATPDQAANIIQAREAQYGKYWPQVFNQLVTDGKLDPKYQTVALLNRPEDGYARNALSQALGVGAKTLKENLNHDDVKSIGDAIPSALSDFDRTARAGGANDGLVNMMHSSVESLALYYAGHGESPGSAVSRATRDIINRYDFSETYRAPKGMLGIAESNTHTAQQALTADALMTPRARPAETLNDEQMRGQLLTQAQRGFWVTNESDSGLVLLYPDKTPVRLKDGSRVELKFDAMKPMQNPASAIYDPMSGARVQ